MQYLAIGDDMYVFFYDDKGTPYGVFTLIDGVQEHLFYLYNAQGDVIAIIDEYAERVVNYEYSAWGELLSVTGSKADTIGTLNPFRSRGYCYDTETGLYYISSRYYDPEIGRWISPEPNVYEGEFDENSGLIGYNVYAYCFNNPITNFDPDGEAVANIVGGVIGGVAGAALGYLLANALGLKGWKKWALISAATVGGAVLGAFLGPYVAKLGGKVAAKLGIKTATKAAFKSIGKITAQKMKHINVPKHLWNKVLKRVTNKGVESLIQQAVKKGTWETLKGGVSKITYRYGGEIITVTGKIINGVFNVGDAWVNR